jgi:hypothetical protein
VLTSIRRGIKTQEGEPKDIMKGYTSTSMEDGSTAGRLNAMCSNAVGLPRTSNVLRSRGKQAEEGMCRNSRLEL